MLETEEGTKQAAQEMAQYYQKLGESKHTLHAKDRATSVAALAKVIHASLKEEMQGMPVNSTAQQKFAETMKMVLGLDEYKLEDVPQHNQNGIYHMPESFVARVGPHKQDEDPVALLSASSTVSSAATVGWDWSAF